MRKKTGAARLICVFFVCLLLLGYNLYGRFFKFTDTDTAFVTPFDDNEDVFLKEENSSKTSSAENTSQMAESKESEVSQAVQTAASGNVKGKIISKYISPYNSGLSYNNVYVKNSTDLKIDIKSLLKATLGFKIKKSDEPQVLIMHTHTTETYMTEDTDCYTDAFSARTRDKDKNMVSIGNTVAEKLNSAGIKTLHDTTEHDYPQYSGSYSRAAKTINSYLKKYPGIKIVLDLHRDAVSSGESDKVKLVTEIDGKKAAQVMIVMGSQSGSVTNFPKWQENLKLALKLQQMIETKYPTLARPLSLMSKSYNQSLTTGSMLIEFGTDANTHEEAIYSAELVGNALVSLLNTLT